MSDLDTKVNYTDSLTLEEIMGSNIDLTNKVASADSVKQLNNNKLNVLNIPAENGAESFFASIGNVGERRVITINLSDREQILFIFGSAESTSNYMTMIGASVNDYSFGKNSLVSTSKNDKTIIVELPRWFRGCIFSYLPFTITRN